MLTIKITGPDGSSAPRDELVTLFASDLSYQPFHRRSKTTRDGVIELEYPGEPVMLHAKITVPGYGFMWVVDDNHGEGYKDGAVVDFVRGAAESRVCEVERVLAKGGFKPSVKCLSLLADAKVLLRSAESAPKAADMNMVALATALFSGELAVLEKARATIAGHARRDNFLFGCGGFSYPYEDNPVLKDIFDGLFNYATLPFYLSRVEWEKDKPTYELLDKIQAAFDNNGIKTKAHPLWWTHTAGMPPWTKDLKWEDGSIQRELKRVSMRSVERYKGRIHYYDVINEAHDWCNAYMLTQQQEAEMTKLCCDAVHEADPTANAVINTCFMFGENVADERVQWGIINERNMTPYSYLQRVEALGTQYETIGIQLYCPSRDMLEIDKLYDRFSVFGKALHLTELGVPSQFMDVPYSTTEGDIYCLRYMYSGLWREMGWSERLQADWLEEFYTISYVHPQVEALTWWGLTDPTYVPAAGLVHPDGTPKEAAFRLKELEKSFGHNFGR